MISDERGHIRCDSHYISFMQSDILSESIEVMCKAGKARQTNSKISAQNWSSVIVSVERI